MVITKNRLTLQEFLELPEGDLTYELIDSQAVSKMAPKRFHSRLTGTIYTLLTQWCQNNGEVGIEWAVILKRNQQDWVPVPDLLYISRDRLPQDNIEDQACPTPPELVIEIISPGQTLGDLVAKATAYLQAGVLRVWLVDGHNRSITVFYPDAPPLTKKGSDQLSDSAFSDLSLTPDEIFNQAGIPQR